MRYWFIAGIILVFPFSAYAEVKEGQATSDIHVETQTNGGGSVSTHIESTVNGKTQVFDSNQPCTYDVHVDSQGNATVTSVPKNPTSTSPSSSPSSTPKPTPPTIATKNAVEIIISILTGFFKRLFNLFK